MSKPIVALCLAAACASGGTAASDSPAEPAVEVQAAALQHVFQNNDSSLGFSAGSYCVGVGAAGLLHSDPSASLLRALGNPKVTRLSGCARVASRTHRWQVIDTLSRLPSLAFLVDLPSFELRHRAGLRGIHPGPELLDRLRLPPEPDRRGVAGPALQSQLPALIGRRCWTRPPRPS